MKNILYVFALLAFCGCIRPAHAEDMYYSLGVKDIEISSDAFPDPTAEQSTTAYQSRQRRRLVHDFMYPYVVGNHNEELYVVLEGEYNRFRYQAPAEFMANMRLVIRAQQGASPSGSLFVPNSDWSGMERLAFSVTTPSPDQKFARQEFLKAKEQHYKRLLDLRIPGAAWFRHQMREARFEREGREMDESSGSPPQRPARSELQESYSLFSGGRAISENLQLDRELRMVNPGEETIAIDSIEGITTTEIDWKEIIAGRNPKRDALAAYIPADQHVLLFPTFQAMLDVIDESTRQGTPILRLVESRSEDAQVHTRYQQQLCLELDVLSRMIGPQVISRVAFTGSDPYLRTGTDVAVLFETANPNALQTTIRTRQAASAATVPDTEFIKGMAGNVAYSGVVSPTRSISSYMAALENVVIVSNSFSQLERIVHAHDAHIPSLAELDEYTFFRDRYRLGEPDESALLIISDATIRRWCGPKWRITAARRTRAAALLAELQASHLDDLVAGQLSFETTTPKHAVSGLGELRMTPGGIVSSVYGHVGFLTPIAEIPLEKVNAQEAEAYHWFRENYQRRWNRYFDPIAIRFSVAEDRIDMDLTIRPLILASDYAEFLELTGNKILTPDSGDPHPETLLHYLLALDADSRPIQRMGNFAMSMAPGIGANALSWLGDWLTVYVDDDPVWQELGTIASEKGERALEDFMRAQFHRLPVAFAVDVANTFKLAGFLTAVRAFVEQTVPGMTVWEALQHQEQSYVKIAPSPEFQAGMRDEAFKDFALYYAVTPRMFLLTWHERLLHHTLERISLRRTATTEETELHTKASSWIDGSLAIQAKQKNFHILQALFQENLSLTLQRRSWSNILILNEWKRRYESMAPDRLHQQFWNTKLTCPGGGEYVWNEEFQTMESTVFGHPGHPRLLHNLPNPLSGILEAGMNITFEADGLRGRVEIQRETHNE